MFYRSVSARKTMIFAVAVIVSIAAASSAGGRPFEMCGLQKNTPVEQFKLSTLYPMFGEVLTTESNGNIYVVSICQPVPNMFYDPRKMSGAIKLTSEGNTVDLGHIDQSNVIVNENSIVLTYVGGDRDRDVQDTCKGLRWTTYLTFLCAPTAIHDILTLIDEDPDQPEICQVWFEVTTSKICNRHPHLPLVVMEKDFSNLKHQIDHEKYRVRESTNSNLIPPRKNEFDYKTSNINKNNKSLNTENREKPNINDSYNKFDKSFSNEQFSTSKENKITNDEIKNGNTIQISSKDHKKQSDNENKDKYLNKYVEAVNEKNEKEESKGNNSKTNTPEDKMSADHENNKFWIEKKNIVPGIPSKREYSYPEKNEIISHYNDLKKYLNQNKNSEGKYENSVLRESTKYDENKYGKLNHEFPEDVSNNDMKYEKTIDNENMEKTSIQNTFENPTSNKEINDSSDNKKPSDNEKKSNQENSKKSNFNNDSRTYNRIPNTDNRIKYNTANEEKIVDTEDNQSQSKDNKSIIYDNNKVPGDVIKGNIANQTHSQNNNSESKLFPKEDQKNEIENHPKNIINSITERTPRADSKTESKPTGSGDKGVDANTFNTTKHTTNDDTNQTHSQNENSESKSFQKEDQKNEIVNNPKNVNSSITERTPRADSTENKPTGKYVDANTINTPKPNTNDGNPTIDVNENNTMKNNYNSTSGNDDNTITVTTKTSPSNTIVNDHTNESGEVNGSSTESPVDGSLNNIKTNNKSEPNGTIINETNNVNKNLQPDQSKSVPSAHSSDNDESDNLKTTTDSTNQSGNGFSFNNLFSNIFPNGIHVSAATIIGALVSLTAVTGVVGTAVNRYYYKQTGTDQIPFKGTIQSIYNSIKAFIISICCCCRRGGYDDLEAPDLTNEKTPLLQPKFNVPTPLLVDETSQKSSDSGDNADSSKQNSSNEYGSMSKEKKSLTSEKKYRKTKRKSKTSDTNLTSPESLVKNVEEKLINIENNLHGKSIKEAISGKINAIFTEKVKPTINSIIEKVGKKVESTEDEIKKDLDKISKDAALISKFVENEKSTNINDDVRVDVNIKSENNTEKTHLNENETQNAVVQDDVKSITFGESQQSLNVKPLSEIIVSQVSVPELQQIKRNEQAPDMKTNTEDRVATEKLIESTNNKKDIDMKNNIENVLDTVVTSPTGTKASNNESKLKFLGFEKEDKNVQKVVTDESIATDKKIENEEDDVEVIEEIIYVDGADGDEDEEIIEEIIETTTVEDSPDESIPGSGKTKVTVRTTRKISSSSLPGEVKTIEETVVTDGIPGNEEKRSGFKFDVGKSGVSMSVGDKKMEIGKSGLNFTRSKSKSPKNVEGDEPDKRDTKSPEKSKKSMMPKIFKRSISQPSDDDIQEVNDESASTKKLPRTGSAGLFKLGKSRSKPTLVLKTGDVTMDADAMSNFMDNERNASRTPNVGLGGLDLTVGDEGVAAAVVVRKTSTTTSGGKDTPVTTETVDISPVDLGFGLDRDRQSAKNAETKSNAKTKREKKDKTKLTTLTRPF
ncbi:putative uncharacterized protein DDB_G0289263 [Acyrthosiphon pisum]|uniref:MRH domain-containing protein n=1 Tax=Acyrthosiphon pisum TaxID=7029 RepID=A0A8R2AC91_ACYPI|nr:putative uncharacterized protein DDB_G0289263 [Acyrthosiphon pisum]|eukprot:XP_001947368.2 PREDICTED: putative uncharacterized protein DDB_G0289263 [Acyrthosiphon pisum]